MTMTESSEVPDEEATESKPDMKDRMRSFGEKAKALGEKTGQRSKELGKKVAEATKETTAKATKAGKKVGSRLSESTAEASEKISVAAEHAAESVSKGVKQTKEKLKQAKEQRDERKAQAATVPQSTQVITVGPDLPDEKDDHNQQEIESEIKLDDDRESELHEPEEKSASEVDEDNSGSERKEYVILPPTGAIEYKSAPRRPSFSTQISSQARTWSSTITTYGPDLVFGWTLLFFVLCTATNAISILSGSYNELGLIPFGIPHLDLAFENNNLWVQYFGATLLFVVLFDSIMLSFAAASIGSFRRITFAVALVWMLPAVAEGPTKLLLPFEQSDLGGFLWHILILPIILLTSTIRVGLMTVKKESDLPTGLNLPEISNEQLPNAASPVSSNTTLKSLPFEVEIMGQTDELMQKPRSRDRMEPYEFIFFMFMWVFLFGGIALLGFVGSRVNTSSDIPSDPFVFVSGACFAVCTILSYIVFRMDRSARSGIDMAKRRERYNAMQDEAWETKRVQYRLAREDMEQSMSNPSRTPSDA
jgi:hypothetical protein